MDWGAICEVGKAVEEPVWELYWTCWEDCAYSEKEAELENVCLKTLLILWIFPIFYQISGIGEIPEWLTFSLLPIVFNIKIMNMATLAILNSYKHLIDLSDRHS